MTTEQHPTVDTTKATDDEFGPILVRVGPGGGRSQRFTGRQLVESRQVSKKTLDTVRVYLTRKGNYVVHRQSAEWADYGLVENWTKDWKNWRAMVSGDMDWGDFTVQVVDSLEALRELVPPKVHRTITDRALHPLTADLDA
ncbi:EXLDI protein [Nocardia asteroides]|uniref:EXLDI protein n=1 Tax=Nocardia asteroides TaxID=1824 RepID=UPI0037C6258B